MAICDRVLRRHALANCVQTEQRLVRRHQLGCGQIFTQMGAAESAFADELRHSVDLKVGSLSQ
jgi:hypothetical protein